jgi:hypothetical protein
VDATGLTALAELADVLARDDIELIVARKPHVRDRVMAGGLAQSIGENRFFPTVRAAVAYSMRVDHPPKTRTQP